MSFCYGDLNVVWSRLAVIVGCVSLASAPTNETVTLVPEDALTRIFDPFFRVEESRTLNGGGSGLGLSIAKRAMQAHHGTITAENAAPGLRVTLAIPLMSVPGTAFSAEFSASARSPADQDGRSFRECAESHPTRN